MLSLAEAIPRKKIVLIMLERFESYAEREKNLTYIDDDKEWNLC